jgi:hypothetical protein
VTTDEDRIAYLAGDTTRSVDPGDQKDLDGLRTTLTERATWEEPHPALEERVMAAIAAASGARPSPAPRARSRRFRPALVYTAFAAAVIVVAGIIGVIVVSVHPQSAETAAFALHSPTGGSASGEATGTDHGPTGWSYRLQVHGLKAATGDQFYECWFVQGPPGHRQFVSGGTFTVGISGTGTFTMWGAVDAQDFKTMEITRESPASTVPGKPVLTGQARL